MNIKMRKKLTKENSIKAVKILWETHPDADCALLYKTPFHLLVAVVMSAQATDKSVNAVAPELFKEYPDADAFAKLEYGLLEKRIKKIGLYRSKSKNIINMSKILVEKYGGEVPANYDDLIKLPGVGRKSANVVLATGFGIPRIAVDTHVFRLSNRIGLTYEKDVLSTELALMKVLPDDMWIRTHHTLIFHGRQICDARKPKCDRCSINHICLYASSPDERSRILDNLHTKKGV